MRLLFLNSIENVMGGAEHFTLGLASRLTGRGHCVLLVARGASRIAAEARARGLETISIPMQSDWNGPAIRAIRDIVNDRGIDVLFSTTWRTTALGGHAAILAGRRGVVARLLAGWTPGEAAAFTSLYSTKKRLLHRLLVRRAVTNSHAGRRELIERGWLPGNRIDAIWNGVDLDRFPPAPPGLAIGSAALPRHDLAWAARRALGIPDTHLVVLSLSRIARHKGQLTELRAAHEVLRDRPDTHFLFVGGGGEIEEYAQSLDAARAAAPDPARIHLLGERRDVPVLLDACDVLVRATTAEGLPNIVLEAMAASRPVIASRVCGTPEAVEEGVTGLLVEPDRPDELASALRRLLARPEERRTMGAAGRERAERLFPIERTIDAYERLFAREAD